jgi:glycyl-tRNA synthetase beta subunit
MGGSNVIRQVANLTSVGMIAKSKKKQAKVANLTSVGMIAKRKKKQARERANATAIRLEQEAEVAQKLQEQEEKTEVAQESVRKQKARARRRTIFAGQPLEQNIFRKTLGG